VGVRDDAAWPTTTRTTPLAVANVPTPAPGPTPSAASPATRRFELVEGSSSKFWEVARDGSRVAVRYGRIGGDGQSKTKELASEDLARRHTEELIAEKVAKGYRESGQA
jgi:predicted DNA-binding WGR domain protein